MAHSDTLQFEESRWDAAVSNFLRTLLPEVVGGAVRSMAVEVVDHTARGLNGAGGTPKRIDTGRLRAGWRVALQNGGMPAPDSASASADSLPGDGVSVFSRGPGGLSEDIEVRNNVEYARYVEEGTETMAPGKHLERALRIVRGGFPRETGPDSIGADMKAAWNGRKP